MDLVILTANPSSHCPASASYTEAIPKAGNSFQCSYHRSGSECLGGKVPFSQNFLFQSLQQTGPTARVGNAAPFVWKKERSEHREELQLSSGISSMPIWCIYPPKWRKFQSIWTTAIPGFTHHFCIFQLLLHNETPENETAANSHPDRIENHPLFEEMLGCQTAAA